MTNTNIKHLKIMGGIDDDLILRSERAWAKRPARLNLKLISVAAAVLALALLAVAAVPGLMTDTPEQPQTPISSTEPDAPEDKYYHLSDLNSSVNYGATSVRSGMSSPGEGSYNLILSKDKIIELFGTEDLPAVINEEYGDTLQAEAIYKASGELHSVYFQWNFPDSLMFMTIDLNTKPKVIYWENGEYWDHESNVNTINGYNVGLTRYDDNSSLRGTMRVLMSRGTMGLWIYGDESYEKDMEEIFNMILNSEMNFEMLRIT